MARKNKKKSEQQIADEKAQAFQRGDRSILIKESGDGDVIIESGKGDVRKARDPILFELEDSNLMTSGLAPGEQVLETMKQLGKDIREGPPKTKEEKKRLKIPKAGRPSLPDVSVKLTKKERKAIKEKDDVDRLAELTDTSIVTIGNFLSSHKAFGLIGAVISIEILREFKKCDRGWQQFMTLLEGAIVTAYIQDSMEGELSSIVGALGIGTTSILALIREVEPDCVGDGKNGVPFLEKLKQPAGRSILELLLDPMGTISEFLVGERGQSIV